MNGSLWLLDVDHQVKSKLGPGHCALSGATIFIPVVEKSVESVAISIGWGISDEEVSTEQLHLIYVQKYEEIANLCSKQSFPLKVQAFIILSKSCPIDILSSSKSLIQSYFVKYQTWNS